MEFEKIFENILKESNIAFYHIDGKTDTYSLQTLANDFNQTDNVKVFLVSLKDGGVGLNLIGADTVIHVDP